jgi:HSP20 family protein
MQTFGPLLEVARIQSEINQLFENLLDLGDPARTSRTWTPSADIAESETALTVTVELPAVEPEDLKVTAFGGQVIIEGEKRPRARDGNAQFQAAERHFGRFRRAIQLSVPVNTHRAEAVLVAGVLQIRFPKVPNRRGEEVAIEVSTS